MVNCNFRANLAPDMCMITAHACDQSGCILQRILAALPAASPIVAQAMDTMQPSPEEAAANKEVAEDAAKIAAKATPITGPRIHNCTKYKQEDVAKILNTSSANIFYHAKKLGLGQKINHQKIYTQDEVERLEVAMQKRKPAEPQAWEIPVKAEINELLVAQVLLYYQEHDHIKLTPEVVAVKLGEDEKEVRRICEHLNEHRQLCFAGQSGYYSKYGLTAEELERISSKQPLPESA